MGGDDFMQFLEGNSFFYKKRAYLAKAAQPLTLMKTALKKPRSVITGQIKSLS